MRWEDCSPSRLNNFRQGDFAAVTGVYSQKVFEKLEHTTLTSLDYDDFRDENGELYLKDTREHTKIITCYKKLID